MILDQQRSESTAGRAPFGGEIESDQLAIEIIDIDRLVFAVDQAVGKEFRRVSTVLGGIDGGAERRVDVLPGFTLLITRSGKDGT